ncbi:MAG: flagellar protein FlaG [Oscillospiraceae bacterium]|nr:flagellar protein FlaG [Oscillospiraceae bacterium]
MAIKKSDLSVPAGGSYRQFGYTPPNNPQKKSTKSMKDDAAVADEENNVSDVTSAISSIAGAHNQINSNIPHVSQSGNVNNNTISTVNTNSKEKVVKAYENNQYNPQKIALEEDLDKLVKQLVPELGVKFKVQDNGQIIASVINSVTKEVVREFPAEKMFDIIHSMSQKLGVVAKRKI